MISGFDLIPFLDETRRSTLAQQHRSAAFYFLSCALFEAGFQIQEYVTAKAAGMISVIGNQNILSVRS